MLFEFVVQPICQYCLAIKHVEIKKTKLRGNNFPFCEFFLFKVDANWMGNNMSCFPFVKFGKGYLPMHLKLNDKLPGKATAFFIFCLIS